MSALRISHQSRAIGASPAAGENGRPEHPGEGASFALALGAAGIMPKAAEAQLGGKAGDAPDGAPPPRKRGEAHDKAIDAAASMAAPGMVGAVVSATPAASDQPATPATAGAPVSAGAAASGGPIDLASFAAAPAVAGAPVSAGAATVGGSIDRASSPAAPAVEAATAPTSTDDVAAVGGSIDRASSPTVAAVAGPLDRTPSAGAAPEAKRASAGRAEDIVPRGAARVPIPPALPASQAPPVSAQPGPDPAWTSAPTGDSGHAAPLADGWPAMLFGATATSSNALPPDAPVDGGATDPPLGAATGVSGPFPASATGVQTAPKLGVRPVLASLSADLSQRLPPASPGQPNAGKAGSFAAEDRGRAGSVSANPDPGTLMATAPGGPGDTVIAPAAAPAIAANPAAAGTISDQVAGQLARLASSGSRDMVMRLHPPELGDLTVRVAVSGRDVSAWFGSPQPLVQSAISAAMGQLQIDLGNAGFNLSGAWVGADASGAQQQGASLPARAAVRAPAAIFLPPAVASRPSAPGLNIYV